MKSFAAAVGAALIILSLPCLAEQFSLSHGNLGDTYGPFDFREGEKIQIGEWILTLHIEDTSGNEPAASGLKSVILPVISFTNATVVQCVQQLNAMIREKNPDLTGANIVLDKKILQEDQDDIYSYRDTALVTLSLQEVSAFDAIKAVCEQTGLGYRTDHTGIYLYSKSTNTTRRTPRTSRPPQ
jgi:hypothetical protein